ncbi:hypothetical protein GJ744_007727 [Endocarpon pusillum]|uniref:Heterokaryon incompatibility domain-containing protein n=1 Tax=Endocarpon pusillum TaxID=364733 RepID=A0A8H7AV06_9EURO|nr:hypothetical protein GJ744_007727 [Endocarpon pusillum]
MRIQLCGWGRVRKLEEKDLKSYTLEPSYLKTFTCRIRNTKMHFRSSSGHINGVEGLWTQNAFSMISLANRSSRYQKTRTHICGLHNHHHHHHHHHHTSSIRVIGCLGRAFTPLILGAAYFALSYVWGQTSAVQNTSSNVAEDAVTVVKTLGRDCLREGKYCINQPDQEEKHEQIQDMGRIYEGATLTIVVVTGVTDEDGLAGVSSTSVVVGKRKLALKFTTSLAWELKWPTRGWTCQECLYTPLTQLTLVVGLLRAFTSLSTWGFQLSYLTVALQRVPLWIMSKLDLPAV